MGLYNSIFGQNPIGHVLLGMLDLTPEDVGRYRDCFISEGKIAVYTRNGGGNRECWHLDDPRGGSQKCKHTHETEEVKEMLRVPQSQAHQYPVVHANIAYIGAGETEVLVETGKMVTKDVYICQEPSSIECACYGCTITYRLPKHPNYLYDRDDEFDYTYATIYFSFPEKWKDILEALDKGEKFDPDQRWQDFIASISGKGDTQ